MRKILSRAFLLSLLALTVFAFAGVKSASANTVSPHSPYCDPGDVANVTKIGSGFQAMDYDNVIYNRSSAPVPLTVTVKESVTVSAQFSASISGKANFIFSEAQIQVGVQLSASKTSEKGYSATFTALPHKELHATYGTTVDHFNVHYYYQTENCNVIKNETYGSFDAPEQARAWNVWDKNI